MSLRIEASSWALAFPDEGRLMEFHAKCVSTSIAVGGDYYQVRFATEQDTDDMDSPYLLIQRDFEMPDDDSCYVETHDERYCRHFILRRIEFTAEKLVIELDRPMNNLIGVTFSLATSEFKEASQVINIISGEIEPEPE